MYKKVSVEKEIEFYKSIGVDIKKFISIARKVMEIDSKDICYYNKSKEEGKINIILYSDLYDINIRLDLCRDKHDDRYIEIDYEVNGVYMFRNTIYLDKLTYNNLMWLYEILNKSISLLKMIRECEGVKNPPLDVIRNKKLNEMEI